MLAEFNKLTGPNKKFLFEANSARVSFLYKLDETTNASLRNLGRQLSHLAHFNQETWEEITSIINTTPTDKIDNIVSSLGVNGYVAGTFMNYLGCNLLPLQKNYNRERQGDYYFYHLGRKDFCTPNEAVEDPLVLGRLVNQGKIDVTCLDPFTFLKLFKKIR